MSLLCMSFDCGMKPEYLEETHQAQGEQATSTHTHTQQILNSQPWSGEAIVITTTPTWHPLSDNVFYLFFYLFMKLNFLHHWFQHARILFSSVKVL